MSSYEHLKILEQGSDKWNTWREQDSHVSPDLSNHDLSNQELVNFNLRGGNLSFSTFDNTNFRGADLRDCDLQNSALDKSIGLLSEQLAGCNMSGAQLPENVRIFEGLNHVEEISKKAGKHFALLLLGCFYSWLIFLTSTDVQLLTDSAKYSLPIVGNEISVTRFFWIAPILLLSLYFYFHLYLQRLWESLADLPAIFPNGRPLNKIVSPWLLTGLVCGYFERLKVIRPSYSHFQNFISILLAWWFVPLTIVLFWLRYLPSHDWFITSFQIFLALVSIVIGQLFYRTAINTLQNKKNIVFVWNNLIKIKIYQRWIPVCFCGVLLTVFSIGAIEGVPKYFYDAYDLPDSNDVKPVGQRPHVMKTFIPRALQFFNLYPFANLEEDDLSNKPINWTGKEIDLVKGAHLRDRNLRFANARRAFLVKADLRHTDFYGANLEEADLRRATDMIASGGHSGSFVNANLFKADLREVNLFGKFDGADLMNADLRGAKLRGASFYHADLWEANLSGANFLGADLRKARLNAANLSETNLSSANLSEADLSLVKHMRGNLVPNLRNTYMYYTVLNKTDLRGVDLSNVFGLTQKQIDSACIDQNTVLPKGLKLTSSCEKAD